MNKKVKIIEIKNKKEKNIYIFITLKTLKVIFLNKIWNKKYYILIYILNLFGVIFYLLSLAKIKGIVMECYGFKGVECYYRLAKLLLISSIFKSITIYLIIIKKYHFIHIIIIFIIYIVLLLIDHNTGIIKHGLYNFIGQLFITSLLLMFLFFISLLYHLYKKSKYFLLFLTIIPLPFLIINLRIYKLHHFSCDNWVKGLNNSYIDNNDKDYPCTINIPEKHSCYLSEIGPFFDLTKVYRPNCLDPKLLNSEKNKFINRFKHLNYSKESQMNHFGYPLTNDGRFGPDDFATLYFKEKRKNFEEEIKNNIILMDLYNKDRNKYYPNIPRPEIEVIFEDLKGKIIINVHKNESLIKEREELIKINKLLYKNILILYFDTVSRAHFFRKFPKTVNFLNKFSRYEDNISKKDMTIFQYFKYNSIRPYTDPNTKAAYYGATIDGNGTHFANFFKNKGYIIGRANTHCEKEAASNDKNNITLIHCQWDHECLSLPCDDIFEYSGIYYSFVKRCLFGKELNQYTLEYLESFWKVYINQNKLFLFQSNDGHEPTGELIGHFDETLYNFLFKFYKRKYLKDTAIIIFSDHGQHLNGPLYLFDSQDFFYERGLPFLFIILPNDKKLYDNNKYEIIKYNQQSFITAFDIYNTFIHIAFVEENETNKKYFSNFGTSLFKLINYTERFCESSYYKSQISKYACNCKQKILN